MILLEYYGELRDITGLHTESIEAASLSDVFRHISRTHGKNALKTAKRGLVTVNGRRALTASKKISGGAVICFYPFCTGG